MASRYTEVAFMPGYGKLRRDKRTGQLSFWLELCLIRHIRQYDTYRRTDIPCMYFLAHNVPLVHLNSSIQKLNNFILEVEGRGTPHRDISNEYAALDLLYKELARRSEILQAKTNGV